MTNSEFKWKHFAPEIILWCLRWYGSTPMSYANLSDMLAERGISVNRSTIYRWFIEYKRNKEAAYQFLKRCLRYYDIDNQPKTLNTDKHSSYANAIARLKKEGRLREDVEQRQVKCLNNGIESDHAPIKKLVVATGGFKLRKRAWSTIQGI
ncbi:IS6 family transposase [Aliivibrio sifiae]|uniref:IS6 family transposase n=1 Tax=Aliivibrio sifiae TaxID=566293 RepID=A0ABQ6AMH7_9GAMM|nr:IS6 family transposase [Aliivibrio sifiae]